MSLIRVLIFVYLENIPCVKLHLANIFSVSKVERDSNTLLTRKKELKIVKHLFEGC